MQRDFEVARFVAIYDKTGDLVQCLRGLVGNEFTVESVTDIIGEASSLDQYFIDKALALRTAANLVVIVDCLEAASFAMSGVRLLLEKAISSLYLVEKIDLSVILGAGFPDEVRYLHSRQAEGAFVRTSEASASSVLSYLRRYG